MLAKGKAQPSLHLLKSESKWNKKLLMKRHSIHCNTWEADLLITEAQESFCCSLTEIVACRIRMDIASFRACKRRFFSIGTALMKSYICSDCIGVH